MFKRTPNSTVALIHSLVGVLLHGPAALMGAALFASIRVHFPLVVNEAADAKAEYGYGSCDGNHCSEQIGGNGPTGKKAEQAGSKATYCDTLIELLLLRIL